VIGRAASISITIVIVVTHELFSGILRVQMTPNSILKCIPAASASYYLRLRLYHRGDLVVLRGHLRVLGGRRLLT
jgi:hypothetical protein